MKVVAGSRSRRLSRELARVLGVKLVEVDAHPFPDGEKYVRLLDGVEGEDVVLVQTTRPDDAIVELFLLQDAVREAGAESVITVVPYYGYGRQDKRFNEGEAISARALARRIQLDSDGFITVDIHSEHILGWFSIPSVEVSGAPAVAEYLKGLDVDVVVAPDRGSLHRAGAVAEKLGVEFDFLEKRRIDERTVEITPKELDVEGKKVAIVDDIISTGGTVIEATRQMKAAGVAAVYAVCTHGIFAANALERMAGLVDWVASSDTIESEKTAFTVADLIAEGISLLQEQLR